MQEPKNNWLELKQICENIGFGEVTITVRDGIPVKVERAFQQIILGKTLDNAKNPNKIS